LKKTGLRGRGGAGYPTAVKWQTCNDAEGDEKYAVCDAVDADPRARTAQLLLGSDPHSVLEGLLIGAYAVGAMHCFACVNGEYGDEIAVLQEALERMRQYGLLGDNILESGFSCDIAVKEITTSLVSGEETALIRALEHKQPLPYLRLAYPTVQGLHDKPTLLNSAETLANVSAVFQQHPAVDHCGAAGVSRGTKIATLSGEVSHPRTVEVPFGTTIGALIEQVEETPLSDLDIKAVQFGGPTGMFFAGDELNTPITYEDMEAAGSIMGSATVRVFSGDTCAVEMTRDVMSYLRDESCGKCVACREVTYQLADMLDDIVEFRGKAEDLELMLELSEAMRNGSICGLGKTACNPLLSSLRLFADDYNGHIHNRLCPAKA
jgi:NADH:ubiquinone oxidoreductase subunit F (NADH-binding)